VVSATISGPVVAEAIRGRLYTRRYKASKLPPTREEVTGYRRAAPGTCRRPMEGDQGARPRFRGSFVADRSTTLEQRVNVGELLPRCAEAAEPTPPPPPPLK